MSGPRLDGLDVARGVAILGTLATNVWLFTAPAGYLGTLVGGGGLGDPGSDGPATALLQQLPNGKSLALLTLLFGMGLELQRASAARRGAPWPGRYPWRALLLLLDGTLHYFLVAEFDVLTGYAVTSLVVARVLTRSDRAQRAWLAVAACWHAVVIAALALAAGASGAGGDPAAAAAAERAARTASWWDLVQLRWENLVLFRLEPVLIAALTLALFLLGGRLLRAGVATPAGAPLRRRLLVLGACALPLDLAVGVLGGTGGFLAARYLLAPLVALGLLAAVLGACARPSRRAGTAWVRRRLAEVGRAALSCYVLQNLLASALCYAWGLDLAGRLDAGTRTAGTLAVLAGVGALVVVLAHLCARTGRRAPLEALMHAVLQRVPGSRREVRPTGAPAGEPVRPVSRP